MFFPQLSQILPTPYPFNSMLSFCFSLPEKKNKKTRNKQKIFPRNTHTKGPHKNKNQIC